MLGMFFKEISVIDGATIDSKGWITGQSVNPSARLYGSLLEEEQVIADFSSAKKHIKEIIDDKETGLDHKLWLFSNSNCKALAGITKNHLNIVSPIIDAQVPGNGVAFMRRVAADFSDISKDVCAYLSVHVLSELKRRWPDKYKGLTKIEFSDGNHISVPCPHTPDSVTLFRYVHGLAKSTSWGCQLITHGHLSYVGVTMKEEFAAKKRLDWQRKIADLLDNTYIVSNEHIVSNEKFPNTLNIVYQSMSRGTMSLTINQDDVANSRMGDVFIVEEEPTIENIVAAVAAHFGEEMMADGVKEFVISEGSNKGACYTF